jgi:uncharacterized membrane protein
MDAMPGTLNAESIGPVDFAVILFEGNEFNGQVAPAVAELQDSGTVRIIDLAFVYKDDDGSVTIVEAEDSEVADAFARVTGSQFDLLNDEDLDEVGAGLDPGSSALVVVWENTWSARLAAAVRDSNGQVIVMERVPRENVLRALAALDEE